MTDDKLTAVVRNWYPRFLANGIDYLDLARTLEQVADWSQWADAWTATADTYERLGDEAEAAGHRVTAAEHLRRASLTLQFAQFVLTDDPDRRQALQRRMSDVYRRAAPLLDPPAVAVSVGYGDGRQVVGYLRVPSGADLAGGDRPGLAVLMPGLESTKEQFSTYEPYFLRRGVATLSVEGPGQGEGGAGHATGTPFRDALYATAMAAVGAALPGLGQVDANRVVVVGTSFGGYLALAHGPELPGLRGIVDIAGPYDLRAFGDLQAVTRDGFRDLVGASDEQEAAALLHDVSLDGRLERIEQLEVPVLVVHGERDTIIDVAHARRVVDGLAHLGDRLTARLEPEGNHSCNNLATVLRPYVADWVADRLAAPAHHDPRMIST